MGYFILVPDNLDKAGLKLLQARPDVTVQAAAKMDRNEVLAAIPNADALIIRSATKVDAAMLDAAPKLKLVGRAGVGVDNVDLKAATERGVVVMNAPDGNTIATAELAFALMLALVRHIPQAHASLQSGQWEKKIFMGTELNGKTLGIVGFGRVGRAIARRAMAFDMTVIAYDPYVPAEVIKSAGVIPVALDDLFARSDFITLHALVNAESRQMINAQSIARMKKGVRIINAARGALIDDAALAQAIKDGQVAGAGLDVYETEPPAKDHPLLAGLPNVITVPHLGASTLEAQDAVAVQIAQQALDALFKNEYQNVVNPDVLKQLSK